MLRLVYPAAGLPFLADKGMKPLCGYVNSSSYCVGLGRGKVPATNLLNVTGGALGAWNYATQTGGDVICAKS